ncbi:hypothetical protein [Bradyrhizobium elkanii]|uniref:hypothetical protein n=1 Tax=Bradyrhizobium elkanii TaxID=29448 RepID=UPI003D1A4305
MATRSCRRLIRQPHLVGRDQDAGGGVRSLDDLYPYQHDIVNELYIKTADDNYVVARWCFANGLDTDFFWLAAHCVEKYLKAALLLNERPARNYGHDIEKLYADVKPLAPELLPAMLTVPDHLPTSLFSLGDESTEAFIKRLYFYGQPDNRYSFIGYIRRGSDILKLDQLVFAVRRLCQPLEVHFLGGSDRYKSEAWIPNQTRRERMLQDDPSSRNLYTNLEQVISGKRGKLQRHVLLNWNLPFAPSDFRHTRMAYGWMTVNPVLVRRFLDPLDAGKPEKDKHADDLWTWARDNLHLPRDFVKAYEKARSDRKAAAKARAESKS